MRILLPSVLALAAAGCVVPRPPAALPPASDGYVAVLSGEMPGGLSQVARHAWIIVNVPGETPRRFEFGHSGSGAFEYFGDGEVAVHRVIHDEPAELRRIVACFEREDSAYYQEHPDYFPIPGPNSNTFVDFLLRHCGVHAELPATAIGRDYRGLVGASVTSAGTGVQFETWAAGLKLGLEEGAELHLFDLPLGVHFWPPGITVPVNPGRIGVDFSMRHEGTPDEPREYERDEREYGLVSLWLWSHYARLRDPELGGGLSDIATVGFDARGGYGSTVGYGFGFDLEGGAGFPASFAYATRLYPAGLVLMLGDNTFIGGYAGVGSDAVLRHVPPRFGVPAELRAEIDLARSIRLGARANVSWYPGSRLRSGGSLLSPYADALVLSTFLRLGRSHGCRCMGTMGRGYFIALERGELAQSAWYGVKFGIEADFGS